MRNRARLVEAAAHAFRKVRRERQRDRRVCGGQRSPKHADVREQLREPAIEIVTPLVERAHRDGQLRRDFDALDLLIALHMLVGTAERREPDRADRYAEMILRGLR